MVHLFRIILTNNQFKKKKSVFVYLDNFLKINRISKNMFSTFLEKLKRLTYEKN